MQVGNEPTRNFATFKPLELQLPFTWASIQSFCPFLFPFFTKGGGNNIHKSCSRASTGQASDLIRPRVSLQSLVFLRNSRHPLFSATIYGLPSTKGTGVICRVPSPEFALSLSFLNQSTCGGFEYGFEEGCLSSRTNESVKLLCFVQPSLCRKG